MEADVEAAAWAKWPERRLTQWQQTEWSAEGEKLGSFGPVREEWEILHHCGHWTSEEANYCGGCGFPLDVMLGPVAGRPYGYGIGR